MKIINKLLRWLNILLVLGTVFSYFSSYVSPKTAWFLSFIGMAFPVFLILNVCFLALFLFLKQKSYWLNILCLAIGMFSINRLITFNDASPIKIAASRSLTIGTYNAQNLLGASRKKSTYSKENLASYTSLFDKKNLSILCLQEGSNSSMRSVIPDYFLEKLNLSYYYKGNRFVSFYSKYPIINKGIVFDQRNNGCIFADIKLDTTIIRVYNVHLQSTGIAPEAQKMLDNQDLKEGEAKQGIANILRRLKRSNLKRADQVDQIIEHIKGTPYPIIVCGDFNDTPFSYTYNELSSGLQDSFMERGSGLGVTYNGPIPGLRIDYILADPKFSILSHEVISKGYSDHYPVISKVSF